MNKLKPHTIKVLKNIKNNLNLKKKMFLNWQGELMIDLPNHTNIYLHVH